MSPTLGPSGVGVTPGSQSHAWQGLAAKWRLVTRLLSLGLCYYGMTLQHEGKWRGQEAWDIKGLPGIVGPAYSEHSQRNMYRYWAKLMGVDPT
jgi:hypothetical protein